MGVGRTAEILAWENGLVLKLFYEGFPASVAVHEAEATRSLHDRGLPVPAVEEVIQVEGRPGILFERIEGPSMLAQLSKMPWRVTRMARLLARLHAALHAHRLPTLPSLQGALENRIRRAPGLAVEEKEGALRALRRLADGAVVCHGDFHPDNVLMSPRGPVVIDWTDVHRGYPLADVAKSSVLIQLGEPPPGTRGRWLIELLRRGFHRTYLAQYAKERPLPQEDLEAWYFPVAAARLADGIPEERRRLVAIVRSSLEGEA